MVVGITFGTFDLLYSGYIEMLREAKTKCDYLIVGLQTDPTLENPKRREPIQSFWERYTELTECTLVDKIITYTTESELEDVLKSTHVNLRIIGQEYQKKDYTGKKWCEYSGIAIYYNSRAKILPRSSRKEPVPKKVTDCMPTIWNLSYFKNIVLKLNSLQIAMPPKDRTISI